MTEARRTKFYLDRANRKWSGVCAGLADYSGLDVTLIRVGAVILTFIGGFPWTLVAYWVAAWVTPDKPRELTADTPERQKFWQNVRVAPGRSIRDIRSTFRDIDRRLADVEVHVTNPNRRLANEIDSLR